MSSHRLCAILCVALAGSFLTASSSEQTGAQPCRHHRYKLVDLASTFGGPQSGFNPGSGNDFGDFTRVLNSPGFAVGLADTSTPDPFPNFCFSDCLVGHAFRAGKDGLMRDIGALRGGGSSLATWITDNDLIAGLSENGKTDPLYPGLPQVRAAFWEDGKIRNLGTLGNGHQSEANAANNEGQVVGASTTSVPDANSMYSGNLNFFNPLNPLYGYQLRAFLWDSENGMQDLGTLGGTDARALLINEKGQVVGHSYTGPTPSPFCNYPLATDSFIWEKGKGMVDLGGLGGTCTVAFNLHQRGQVVGISNLAGDQLQHAFLWENGKLQDLGGSLGGSFTGTSAISETGEVAGYGYLAGDQIFHATLWRHVGSLKDLGVLGGVQCSGATGINSQEQVVGVSVSECNSETANVRAFLWEKGSMFDLNELIPSDSRIYLQNIMTISERGEIAGNGVDAAGNPHAFVPIPCDENHPAVEGCDYSVVDASAAQNLPAPPAARGLKTPRLAPHGLPGGLNLPLSFARHPGAQNQVPRAQISNPILNAAPAVPTEVEKCPNGAVIDDERGDPTVDPAYFDGRCIESKGELTGSCVIPIHVGPSGCIVKRGACRAGTKAKKPGTFGCCGFVGCVSFTVDLETRCPL